MSNSRPALVKGKRYVIAHGYDLFDTKAIKVSKCGRYMRCRFGPYLFRGEWVSQSHVVAEL